MNKRSLFKAIIMLSILAVPFIKIHITPGESQDSIWETEPKVHWGEFSLKCWWLEGHKDGIPNGAWMPSANALRDAYDKKTFELVRDNLAMIYVNDYNNTIFVVLKSLDPEVTTSILEIMNPPSGVSVKFRKGLASLDDLEKWKKEISSNLKLLKEKDVKVHTIIQTANGTLLLGIEDLTIEKLEKLTNILKDKVPPGILEIYNQQSPISLEADQSAAHRPLIAGIKVITHSLTEGWGQGATLGFYVTWNNGNNHGMLTAAHVAQHIGTEAYQGGKSAKYKFGDTVEFAGGPYSDSALIEFDNGMSGMPNIWSSGDPIKIVNKLNYDDLFEGQIVKKVGIATEMKTGSITGFGNVYNEYFKKELINQTFVNIESAGGDSGAPYYYEFQTGGEKYHYACGLHWGRSNETGAVFSPLDNIEEDFGFSLDFQDSNKPYWTEDFYDNEYNAALWYKLQRNGGLVTETGGKLELFIPESIYNLVGIAGYMTQWKYKIDNSYVEIEVKEFDDLDEMLLFIGTEKVGYNPWFQTEWYRCLKTKYSGYDYDWYIQKKRDGEITTIQQDSTSGSFKMRIAVDEGYILFYEDNNLRHVEEYDWSDDVYASIYTSTLETRNHGTDYMDNFKYQEFDLDPHYWIDDFDDGDWDDEWALVSGSASVSGGKLQLSQNGQVKTWDTFSVNRYVKADVRTISHGENHWEVALVQAKYENWNNQVYALIWPDGTVELAIRYGGYQNGWATGPGRVSNPDQEHKWEFIISGDYCLLKIDDEIIFNKYHDHFGDIQGKVGLCANWPSTASFDDVVVID